VACFENAAAQLAPGGRFLVETMLPDLQNLPVGQTIIPFRATPQLKLSYRGTTLRHGYSPDFICFEQIIVELKAARDIAPEHRAQTMNYLRATGLQLGLLVNFGAPRGVQIERFAL